MSFFFFFPPPERETPTLNLTLRAGDLGARRRCEVDLFWLSQASRAAVALCRRPLKWAGAAWRSGSALLYPANYTGSALSFSLPALPARTWRPLNPPAALEGDLEKAERRAAADHAGPPEGLGSISDAWLRGGGWRGGWRVSSGAQRLLGALIGAAGFFSYFIWLSLCNGSWLVLTHFPPPTDCSV